MITFNIAIIKLYLTILKLSSIFVHRCSPVWLTYHSWLSRCSTRRWRFSKTAVLLYPQHRKVKKIVDHDLQIQTGGVAGDSHGLSPLNLFTRRSTLCFSYRLPFAICSCWYACSRTTSFCRWSTDILGFSHQTAPIRSAWRMAIMVLWIERSSGRISSFASTWRAMCSIIQWVRYNFQGLFSE